QCRGAVRRLGPVAPVEITLTEGGRHGFEHCRTRKRLAARRCLASYRGCRSRQGGSNGNMMADQQRNQLIGFRAAWLHVLQGVITPAAATEIGFLVGIIRGVCKEAMLQAVDSGLDRFGISDRAQMSEDL